MSGWDVVTLICNGLTLGAVALTWYWLLKTRREQRRLAGRAESEHQQRDAEGEGG